MRAEAEITTTILYGFTMLLFQVLLGPNEICGSSASKCLKKSDLETSSVFRSNSEILLPLRYFSPFFSYYFVYPVTLGFITQRWGFFLTETASTTSSGFNRVGIRSEWLYLTSSKWIRRWTGLCY